MKSLTEKKGIFEMLDLYTEKFENVVMGIGLLAISAIVFANVIARYFFHFSLEWSEEVSRYIVVWVTFFGISSCARYDAHVSVDLVPNKVKGNSKFIINMIIKIISLAASIYLSYISILFTVKQYASGNTSVAIAIPIWLIYLSTSIGFILLSYVYIRKIMKLVSDRQGIKPVPGSKGGVA